MSQFSEKLKDLIKESGLTIYQISKAAELDRTTIQRSISGERVPGMSFVEKLCYFLRVSPAEQSELLELYMICKIGEKTYADRQSVKKMIEQIAALHIVCMEKPEVSKFIAVSDGMEQKLRVFKGQYQVNNMIQYVLDDEAINSESPCFNLIVPFTYTFLFDYLRQLYWASKGEISVEHIVQFSKNPHDNVSSNANLDMLTNILPFAFCMGHGYQSRYYYAGADVTGDITLAMPFYFYTGRRLVTLAADFKTAILYNDRDTLAVYQENFQFCTARSHSLVQQLGGCLDMISVGFKSLDRSNPVSHVIEPQPCFAKYYTHEMVEQYLRPEIPQREEIRMGLCSIFDIYKTSPCKNFFTIEGLSAMIITGRMADLPSQFAIPFTIEDRKRLLTLLREDIQHDLVFSRAIDTSNFMISSFATIQIYEDSALTLFAAANQGIVSCQIKEHSICNAFHDFFVSLPESKLLFSKEDTMKVLDHCIAQLDAMEGESSLA